MEQFFYAKYKHIKRSELLPNIILRRTFIKKNIILELQRATPRGKIRKRAAQQGRGLFSALKKIAKNPVVRKLAKKGLSYVPQVYNYSQ